MCGANPALIALMAGHNGRLSARRQSATVFVLPPGQFPLKKRVICIPRIQSGSEGALSSLVKQWKQLQNSSERSTYGLSDAVSEWIVHLFQES